MKVSLFTALSHHMHRHASGSELSNTARNWERTEMAFIQKFSYATC